jgi:2-(1,2-epoxy-1,2-dihydrophenyl)acetyl-CoA isomerase
MDQFSTISFEREDNIAIIHLNRPDAANGFNLQMASELAAAAARCDNDSSIRAVVLTGRGRFFSAGGDIKSMTGDAAGAAAAVKRIADELHRGISTFQRMRAPLVVAVNGVCAGAGFSLAVTGDLVIAAESARFTMAYTSIGLNPDGSASYFLPRLIGLRRTQELMFTNRALSSAEALEWGLVTAVAEDSQVMPRALGLARDLAAGSITSHGHVKQLLLGAFDNNLETQMELEGRLIAAAVGSENGQEGIRSFLEKRKPSFR